MAIQKRSGAVALLSAFIALVIVACSGPSTNGSATASAAPTATFSPADATATWVAFEPELKKIAAEVLEQQSAQATVIAATQLAIEPTLIARSDREPRTTLPDLQPPSTLASLPERAIATGPVNRIAYSDGRGSIFTVNPDGTGSVTVGKGSTRGGDFSYTFPVWSPDGGTLLFSSFFIVENAVIQSSLHRADADGNGAIVTLAVDPTSQGGLGAGVPNFPAWSPSGDRIALTTSGELGIGTMLLGSYSGEAPKGLALGAPLYINWAPDGTSILVHQNAGLNIISVDGDTSGVSRPIGIGSLSYNSPSWAPDSERFVHIETIGGNTSIVVTSTSDLDTSEIIGVGDTRVGLGWSPDGKKIAIVRSSGAAFKSLSIYDLESGQERTIHEGETRAFWWSPDSSKLAVIDDSSEIELAHTWSIIDVESGSKTSLVTQFVSDDFLFVLAFFDQYRESHNIWSPDSSKIVVSGTILNVEEIVKPGGTMDLSGEFDSQIWVLDASGVADPVSVGKGTIASWSPQ